MSQTDSSRPRVLVTNDDGVDAPGIQALADALSEWAEVWVVAPATEQSGVSSSLSLHDPVRIREHGERRFSVNGTPADCVYMALVHILPERPSLCVSGVNHGANLGDDVLYSGTVAAGLEATIADVTSVAVSLAAWGKDHDMRPAAKVGARVAKKAMQEGLPRGVLLNVNAPLSLGLDDDPVIEVAKLGKRNYERSVDEHHDPRGRPYYWIGGKSIASDDIPGTDCNAVAAGKVSVTPIQLDMTHYRFLRSLESWSF